MSKSKKNDPIELARIGLGQIFYDKDNILTLPLKEQLELMSLAYDTLNNEGKRDVWYGFKFSLSHNEYTNLPTTPEFEFVEGLGNRYTELWRVRRAKGVTQKQISELLGIKLETYRMIEKGVKKAPKNLLEQIYVILEIPLKESNFSIV